MPINKLALIRYKTIDNCLRNRQRKWSLDDLVDACSESLYEFEGIKKGVSKRTVQMDIQIMRSEKLGYNAPIIVENKKYYSYEDKEYSITNSPLNAQDLETLSEVVGVLRQFSGFGYFNDLSGMVSKLEDRISGQRKKGKSFIYFEKNDLLKGLEFVEPLHKAILGMNVLEVSYQSFKARQASAITFYPYLLREYRNRWFLIGMNKKRKEVLTLALDRIMSFNVLENEKYIKNTIFDAETWFDDVIGVTKTVGQRPLTIVMRISRENAPYILTKPLHSSQKVLKREDNGSLIFSLTIIWNFELEREIIGFGESITVLGPRHLKKKIVSRLEKTLENYRNEEKTMEERGF